MNRWRSAAGALLLGWALVLAWAGNDDLTPLRLAFLGLGGAGALLLLAGGRRLLAVPLLVVLLVGVGVRLGVGLDAGVLAGRVNHVPQVGFWDDAALSLGWGALALLIRPARRWVVVGVLVAVVGLVLQAETAVAYGGAPRYLLEPLLTAFFGLMLASVLVPGFLRGRPWASAGLLMWGLVGLAQSVVPPGLLAVGLRVQVPTMGLPETSVGVTQAGLAVVAGCLLGRVSVRLGAATLAALLFCTTRWRCCTSG